MRNTYDPDNLPKNNHNQNQRNNANNSKDRFTYTANHHKTQSLQKHGSTATNNQKMTKKIVQVIKRISCDGRYSVSTTLKPNQKTLINTIAHLLNSFDGKFEPSNLEVDMIIDLFRMLGYPSNINKTYFQPVGAPHTWGQCLQMMDWLASIASFHFQMHVQMCQAQIDQDLNQIMVRSIIQEKPDLPKEFLERDINRIQKQLGSIKYNIQSKQLAIKNLHASQKDISILQQQEKDFQQILFREKQEVISSDQKMMKIIKQIQQIEKEIQQEDRLMALDDKTIESLNRQIKTQELSVDQMDRIRGQIKDYRQKILNLKNNHQKQCQQIEKTNDNIINSYRQFSTFIQSIDRTLSKGKIQIQKRNVYLNFPEQNINNLMVFLKDKKQQRTAQHIEQMMGTNAIREILEKSEILISIINSEQNHLKSKKQSLQRQNQDLMKFNYEKEVACQQQQKLLRSCQAENNRHRSQQMTLQRQNLAIVQRINQQQNRANGDQQAQADLMKQLKNINQQIKGDAQFLNEFEMKSQQTIEKMIIGAEQSKEMWIGMMIDQRDYFKNLCESLDQERPSGGMNSQMCMQMSMQKKEQGVSQRMEIQK